MVEPMADLIKKRVLSAAQILRVANPIEYVEGLINRSFPLPTDDWRYRENYLAPGSAPFEVSFSEREPYSLRFTLEPLGPGVSPLSRRFDATNEMRRLTQLAFGKEALKWFDRVSEEWRGFGGSGQHFGAWFGNSYDRDGMDAAKIYYELAPDQINGLNPRLLQLVSAAVHTMPNLMPLYTTITCHRQSGVQRITFAILGPLRLMNLGRLMGLIGLGHRHSGLMQMAGLVLGGRFDLPEGSALLALGDTEQGPELKLEILLDRIPDLPANFLQLLSLGMAERPRQQNALGHWLEAITPQDLDWPGDFSVLSIRANNQAPISTAVYLRPIAIHPDLAREREKASTA